MRRLVLEGTVRLTYLFCLFSCIALLEYSII